MKFALSTNWCNQRIDSGEAIADKAIELGFDELELGFHTTAFQVKGFKQRLDQIKVGSVHAFCPVPISAPQGYPELYQLASFDEEGRKMARLQVTRNVEFAADMGAGAVVLHAGRVMCRGFIRSWDERRRIKRGRKMVEVLKKELELIQPILERHKIVLGLENLPYYEGFPAEWEIGEVVGDWVKPWLDTGHHHVREVKRWYRGLEVYNKFTPIGLHINDSLGGDDHLPPGEGQVDFKELKTIAEKAQYLVFEPHSGVSEAALRRGLELIKGKWVE